MVRGSSPRFAGITGKAALENIFLLIDIQHQRPPATQRHRLSGAESVGHPMLLRPMHHPFGLDDLKSFGDVQSADLLHLDLLQEQNG